MCWCSVESASSGWTDVIASSSSSDQVLFRPYPVTVLHLCTTLSRTDSRCSAHVCVNHLIASPALTDAMHCVIRQCQHPALSVCPARALLEWLILAHICIYLPATSVGPVGSLNGGLPLWVQRSASFLGSTTGCRCHINDPLSAFTYRCA
jgi:hypothetical protein